MRFLILRLCCLITVPALVSSVDADEMEFIVIAKGGSGFALSESGAAFRPWGVNYDHDANGRLIEDYWHDEWATVEGDFAEMKALGANVVRVHLQLGKFMASAIAPEARELARLKDLVRLAGKTGLYLDLTGLGCYHKADIPAWYDALEEAERWKTQARFWSAVAGACAASPAVFCYDLMNEPVLPGTNGETEWLAGELGGKFFVQRIALEERGRKREEIAAAWMGEMVSAIRENDPRHLVTVGVIPWATVFPKAKPLFHDRETGKQLDFVSVHFYPESGKLESALEALRVYEVGKPLLVEEVFPLKCSGGELEEFINRAGALADGWVSFYWGRTAAEYSESGQSIADALIGDWLRRFRRLAPAMTSVE
jgi:hypothetical protein